MISIANKLLKFSVLGLEGKRDKESMIRIMQLSIMSFIAIIFLLIQAVLSLILLNSLVISILSIVTAMLLVLNLRTNIKNRIITGLPTISLLFFGITLLAIIATGNINMIGTLIIGIFPVFAYSISGSKGFIPSIVFGLLSITLFFINIEQLPIPEHPISFKIFYIISYITAFAISYMLDAFKHHFTNEAEKEILNHKNENKLREEFIARLSHQIRTPLNNLLVISNILNNTDLDEKQRDMIETIQASTNNLVNVVNSMVDASKIDTHDGGELYIDFNLYSTLSNTLKLFSSQSLNNVSFNLKIDEGLPKSFNGDPVKIKQIFLNIIENIIKNKSSNRATIDIKAAKSKENEDLVELYFEIKCNRPIMLPMNESQNQFIINETTFTSASTQIYIELLDLSITKKLIESNNGKMSIHLSSENADFAFTYTLKKAIKGVAEPNVVQEDLKQSVIREKAEQPRITPAIDLENANVLLVEDNLINQKIVILSLKKLVKNIEIANNGKEALDKFGTSKYDIILMDIQMPIMNGIVTTKKIREIESSTNSHTPVIAITANALLGDKEECLSAGMDDYISKPFQIEILIQKMRTLLRA